MIRKHCQGFQNVKNALKTVQEESELMEVPVYIKIYTSF